jgi:hypothetical protein
MALDSMQLVAPFTLTGIADSHEMENARIQNLRLLCDEMK